MPMTLRVFIFFQLEEGHGGVSTIEPVHTGLADDVTLLLGTTSNHILEGSFTVQFVPLVKVWCSLFTYRVIRTDNGKPGSHRI